MLNGTLMLAKNSQFSSQFYTSISRSRLILIKQHRPNYSFRNRSLKEVRRKSLIQVAPPDDDSEESEEDTDESELEEREMTSKRKNTKTYDDSSNRYLLIN